MIEAEVTEVVKGGGLVVDVGQRGFVPALISTDFIEDFLYSMVKQSVLKWKNSDPENNRVILSRKAVEQLENDAKKLQY